jgi:peroxiredoxin
MPSQASGEAPPAPSDRADFGPGAVFPDLELPDHNAVVRHLSELAEGDPFVLVFFRGWWCPKEQTFFRGLARLQDEMEVAYARLVAVSIDEPVAQSAFRAGLGARWTFLSDAAERYVDELGLRETTDTVHRPYAPTTFVLRPDLTVHSAYNGYWFWGRPTLEDLRQDLRAVTRSLRPDWEVPR